MTHNVNVPYTHESHNQSLNVHSIHPKLIPFAYNVGMLGCVLSAYFRLNKENSLHDKA